VPTCKDRLSFESTRNNSELEAHFYSSRVYKRGDLRAARGAKELKQAGSAKYRQLEDAVNRRIKIAADYPGHPKRMYEVSARPDGTSRQTGSRVLIFKRRTSSSH
jgi:hypothetical protein